MPPALWRVCSDQEHGLWHSMHLRDNSGLTAYQQCNPRLLSLSGPQFLQVKPWASSLCHFYDKDAPGKSWSSGPCESQPVFCTDSLNLSSFILLTKGLPLMPKSVLLSLLFGPEEPARVCWLKGMRTDDSCRLGDLEREPRQSLCGMAGTLVPLRPEGGPSH